MRPMKVIESYAFSNGKKSLVLQDEEGNWFLGDGGSLVSPTDEEGANLIIALAQDAKRRDAEEWPDLVE